jgi:hypothetical protein
MLYSVKSIMQSERACYLCGRITDLELHHVFGGVANRKISTRLGLTCYLCRTCHTGTGGAQYDKEKNRRLKAEAQTAFERTHTRQEWMQIIGKNYL